MLQRHEVELIAIASALKNVPITPVMVMSGRNTTIGVNVDPINGTCGVQKSKCA